MNTTQPTGITMSLMVFLCRCTALAGRKTSTIATVRNILHTNLTSVHVPSTLMKCLCIIMRPLPTIILTRTTIVTRSEVVAKRRSQRRDSVMLRRLRAKSQRRSANAKKTESSVMKKRSIKRTIAAMPLKIDAVVAPRIKGERP